MHPVGTGQWRKGCPGTSRREQKGPWLDPVLTITLSSSGCTLCRSSGLRGDSMVATCEAAKGASRSIFYQPGLVISSQFPGEQVHPYTHFYHLPLALLWELWHHGTLSQVRVMFPGLLWQAGGGGGKPWPAPPARQTAAAGLPPAAASSQPPCS